MIRRIVLLLVVFGWAAGLSVSAGETPRFVIVDGELPEMLEGRLRFTGSAGYRLIATAEGIDVSGRSRMVALLEQDTSGKSFEYAVRSGTGDLTDDSMRLAIDPLVEQGFRLSPAGFIVRKRPEIWLPKSAYDDQATIVLERNVGARGRWAYASLGFGKETTFYSALDERRREGYEILGLWNTDRKLQLVLQRPESRDAPLSYGSADDYRLLLISTRKALKIRLNRLAGKGYRIREAEDPPTTGPPILLLERTAEIGKSLEYRFFKAVRERMRSERFAHKLNRRAARGWRLTPGSLTDSVFALERDPSHESGDPPASYRLISFANGEALASAVEEAYAEGYSVVTMVVEPARTSVLLELETGAPLKKAPR